MLPGDATNTHKPKKKNQFKNKIEIKKASSCLSDEINYHRRVGRSHMT